MYSERWHFEHEKTSMQSTLNNSAAPTPTPPETLEAQEEPGGFQNMLNSATTSDERRFVELIDVLADEAWQFHTGKALRGELRRLWKTEGRSEWSFYKAFHAVENRRAMA